jgi:AcrR family transcriptional regulator
VAVNASSSTDAKTGADRIADILEAACRAIARSGARKLSLRDVAREAGVSKALIHYYFKSREDLLAQAYLFADDRARRRVRAEVDALESAAVRLKRLLLLYFKDEPELREDWILWSELSASAVFDSELRSTMESSFATWTAWMEALIEDTIDEGLLNESTDPNETALRLTALNDGLGSLVVRGLISHTKAREILTHALERELRAPHAGEKSQPSALDGRYPAPATGYLRRLAALTQEAVGELESLASSTEEEKAIRTVTALIDRVGGGAIRRVGDPTRTSQPRQKRRPPAKDQPNRRDDPSGSAG